MPSIEMAFPGVRSTNRVVGFFSRQTPDSSLRVPSRPAYQPHPRTSAPSRANPTTATPSNHIRGQNSQGSGSYQRPIAHALHPKDHPPRSNKTPIFLMFGRPYDFPRVSRDLAQPAANARNPTPTTGPQPGDPKPTKET